MGELLSLFFLSLISVSRPRGWLRELILGWFLCHRFSIIPFFSLRIAASLSSSVQIFTWDIYLSTHLNWSVPLAWNELDQGSSREDSLPTQPEQARLGQRGPCIFPKRRPLLSLCLTTVPTYFFPQWEAAQSCCLEECGVTQVLCMEPWSLRKADLAVDHNILWSLHQPIWATSASSPNLMPFSINMEAQEILQRLGRVFPFIQLTLVRSPDSLQEWSLSTDLRVSPV